MKHTLALILILIVLVSYVILNSQVFFVEELKWTGLTYIHHEELELLLEFVPQNALRIDRKGIGNRLESHPWVDLAKVTWVLPNEILITITERRPLALVPFGENWYLLDPEGVLLPPPRGVPVHALPLVTRLDPEDKEELLTTARLLSRVPADLWEVISEWNKETRQFTLRDGTQIRLGESRDLEEKFRVVMGILDDLSQQGKKVSSINVEVPRNPVIVER